LIKRPNSRTWKIAEADGRFTSNAISTQNGLSSTFSRSDIKSSLRQTAENETTSATKHYDAFGNETSNTGTWHGPFQYGGNFGYQTDTDSGLKLLGHRYYEASEGRFLTRDPIKDGRNWFGYCANNPINSYDANGLMESYPNHWRSRMVRGTYSWNSTCKVQTLAKIASSD
jgi:RHS repeat-associated protein